jgi:hypothetical protein
MIIEVAFELAFLSIKSQHIVAHNIYYVNNCFYSYFSSL